MNDLLVILVSSDHFRGVAFAIFGGFVRVYVKHKGRLRLRTVFSGLLAASFIGAVLVELIRYYGMDRKLIGVSGLLSGFLHTEMIEIVTRRFLKRMGEKEEERE